MRRTTAVAVVVAAVVGVWLALTVWRVLWPASSSPTTADAVVVLAGGTGDRLDGGMAMIDDGVADVLVLSNGTSPGWWPKGAHPKNWLCAEPQAFEVVCPVPEPATTRGEVAMVRALAAERGWRSVAVVTSDYHAHRTGTLFERCLEIESTVAAMPSVPTGWSRVRVVLHEIAGAAALVVDRRC